MRTICYCCRNRFAACYFKLSGLTNLSAYWGASPKTGAMERKKNKYKLKEIKFQTAVAVLPTSMSINNERCDVRRDRVSLNWPRWPANTESFALIEWTWFLDAIIHLFSSPKQQNVCDDFILCQSNRTACKENAISIKILSVVSSFKKMWFLSLSLSDDDDDFKLNIDWTCLLVFEMTFVLDSNLREQVSIQRNVLFLYGRIPDSCHEH